MRVINVHERGFSVRREHVAEVLDSLAGENDRLWPGDTWPPMKLNAKLGVGAAGGHGPVRYRVCEYVPGDKIMFRFDKTGIAAGLNGCHFFEIVPLGEKVILRHTIDAQCTFATWLHWAIVIRPLHDALLEDALDRAAHALDPTFVETRRWGVWVRVLRFALTKATPRP